jgi:AcrR family transcriptional regulator
MRDIQRCASLSVGSFYNYFKNKEEIVAAVAELAVAEVRSR